MMNLTGFIRRQKYTVVGSANDRVLTDTETSQQGRTVEIVGVMFTETGTFRGDATIEGWMDTDQVLQAAEQNYINNITTLGQTFPPFIAIGLKVPLGRTFKLGHSSGANASTITYTLLYRVVEEQANLSPSNVP